MKDCDAAFAELKHRLTTAPVLTISDQSSGFVIYSDASGQGFSCVLMQHDRVVYYTSRLLKSH